MWHALTIAVTAFAGMLLLILWPEIKRRFLRRGVRLPGVTEQEAKPLCLCTNEELVEELRSRCDSAVVLWTHRGKWASRMSGTVTEINGLVRIAKKNADKLIEESCDES